MQTSPQTKSIDEVTDLVASLACHLGYMGADILQVKSEVFFSNSQNDISIEVNKSNTTSSCELDSSNDKVSLVEQMQKTLDDLKRETISCRKCRLCEGRTNVVFGVGSHNCPPIVFVGEGPGAEEDAQGEPFVGKSGQLLTRAIENGMGLLRTQVYICNVVKCRPPENRAPLPDEVQVCLSYLEEQLQIIKPKAIVTLGGVALKALLGDIKGGITANRGVWRDWKGMPLLATYHPAYLLRNPNAKIEFWEDLKLVMSFLGLEKPGKKPLVNC